MRNKCIKLGGNTRVDKLHAVGIMRNKCIKLGGNTLLIKGYRLIICNLTRCNAYSTAACAAANRAIGTRNGEQLT